MIRVLLADDQPLLRKGFALILTAQPDIEVVGEACDGSDAVRLAGRLHPDVVLMDVRMPVLDGIAATRAIVTADPGVRVLILTTFDLDAYAFSGLRAGASGFLLKNTRPMDLLAGIRLVAAGDAVIAPSTTRRLLDTFASTFATSPGPGGEGSDPLVELTPRERDTFAALADGLSNQEIAARLFISETTTKTHVTRVLAKLGLRDRVQAVIYAYENKLA